MAQTPRYTERLTVAWWLWLPAIALVGLLAFEVFLLGPSLGAFLPYLVLLPFATVVLWRLGRIQVAVQDDEFLVDDARLPLRFVADATVLDAATKSSGWRLLTIQYGVGSAGSFRCTCTARGIHGRWMTNA